MGAGARSIVDRIQLSQSMVPYDLQRRDGPYDHRCSGKSACPLHTPAPGLPPPPLQRHPRRESYLLCEGPVSHHAERRTGSAEKPVIRVRKDLAT